MLNYRSRYSLFDVVAEYLIALSLVGSEIVLMWLMECLERRVANLGMFRISIAAVI